MPPPSFTPIKMADGMSWLLHPVRKGMCKYESLLDGTLSLVDIANMNDYLNVEMVNEYLAQEAVNKNG